MTISDPPTLNLFFLAMADADAEYQDKYEHYNYDQDKAIMSGHSGELLSLGSLLLLSYR